MPYVGKFIQPQSNYYTDLVKQDITGDDVSDTYTLSFNVATANNLLVSREGSVLEPNIDYTATGNAITFSSIVGSAENVWVVFLSRAQPSISPVSNSVNTASIIDSSVTADKLATNAVTSDKILNNAVTSDKILNNAVTADKIVGDSITTDKILNDAVTSDKLANSISVTDDVKAGYYLETFNTVTSSSASLNLDCSTGNVFRHQMSENTTLTFTNVPNTGTSYSLTLIVEQDNLGSGFTLTPSGAIDWPYGTGPTFSTGANQIDIFVFITHDGGNTWYGFVSGQEMG